MTAEGKWRRAYRILTTNCGLSHYAIREIFKEHLGGLSFHRNLLHTELKRLIERDEEEINGWVGLLNNPDPEVFIASLMRVVYGEGYEPDLPYHVVREIVKRVRSLNEWDEKIRRRIDDRTRRILSWESRSGLTAWNDRLLLTYLRIRGVSIEV